MALPPLILWTLRDWADAVAALPAVGALPLRTVLVPHERHAHALRRALLRTGRGAILAGTRFVGPLTLAIELLHDAAVAFEPGEDALRPARLLALFASEDLGLEQLDPLLLRTTRGWDDAFARAIGDLEGAGLAADTLPTSTARWRDLARLWRRLDAAAGARWTSARILREAAARLEAGAATPPAGPILAIATGHERAVQARFLRALPGARLGLLAARPLRERHLARVEALLGREARRALAEAAPAAAGQTERDLLQRLLFADPETLADPALPRSAGPDGTVTLEEHAGVEAELEAAADWVARQVLEEGRALEDVAVLVPYPDPVAALLAQRLERLPFQDGALAVHVAGGLPATSLAGGVRVLAVLRALSAHLSAEAVAAVLPGLRCPLGDRQHLTHGEAMEVAWGLGTAGGNAAHPGGALDWAPRAAAREAELVAVLARSPEGDPEGRETWHVERALERIRAARPALEALVAVAARVVGGAPLADLALALRAFLGDWLLDPGGGPPVSSLLGEALADLSTDAVGGALRGSDALEVLEARLLALRVPRGRFGEPAVLVGRLADAAGLELAAIRVLGLCEGALPAAAREDPVLPDAMREEAGGVLVPTAADGVLSQLQAFDRVLRGAGTRIALSAPRVDLEHVEREPSSLFVDVGAALRRPDAGTGRPGDRVPSLKTLHRDAFAPARREAAVFRDAHPVSRAAWLDRAAASSSVPPGWREEELLDPERAGALLAPGKLGPADGLLPGGEPFPAVPGLTPERPISASGLADLLACPRYFLYRRVLGWDDPAEAPSLSELDPLTYGGLFHAAMEEFYRGHGKAFVAGEGALDRWQALADELASRRFGELLSEYPLVGAGIREKERLRLRDDVRSFLSYDFQPGRQRTFVDVERPFGVPEPVPLALGDRTLWVRGYIDRLDVEDGYTLVRDLKTGRSHPRLGDEAGPTPGRDLQLALYGIVTGKLARGWGLPGKVRVAYAYAGDRGHRERGFREDYALLEASGLEWLTLAARILAERAFVSTPEPGDCTYCSFRALCGAQIPARAAAGLRGRKGVLGAFRQLKSGPEEVG